MTHPSIANTNRLSFSPVTLEDQSTVDYYMKNYGRSSCQHSFVALYSLNEKYDSRICEENGYLYILRKGLSTDTHRVYLAPFGQGDLQAAYERLLADAEVNGCKAIFQTVTRDQVDFLKDHFPGRFQYKELRDYAEYIYDSKRIATLSGGKLSDKRNKVNKLLRTYGEELCIKKISKEIISDILTFEKQWFIENSQDHDRLALELEARCIQKQLENYEKLELRGVAIYIHQEMVAFAYGTILNGVCFDGLIAKATRRVKNLYKLLYQTIAKEIVSDYPYFNWEEDVGVPGLRHMKMEYDPVALMRKYSVVEKDAPSCDPEPASVPLVTSIPLLLNEDQYPNESPPLPGFSFSEMI